MRFVFLLALILGLDYVFFHWVLLPTVNTPAPLITGLYWSITILSALQLFFFPRKHASAIHEPTQRDLRAIILIIYLSKFLGLVLVLAFSLLLGGIAVLLGLLGLAEISRVTIFNIISIAGLIITLFLIAALVWGMLVNRYRFKLHRVQVPIDNLPDSLEGFKLIQLSDIHAGSFTDPKHLKQAINLINEQEPDLICFTGDLVNNAAEEIAPYINTFKQLQSKFGIYAILGNHDYGDYVRWPDQNSKSENLNRLVAAHNDLGWKLLRDESSRISIGQGIIQLIGVENISAKGRFQVYGNLEKAYGESHPADVKILLSHDPSHWRDEVLDYKDINLCLSGHTHGMQFGLELGRFIKWSPVKYVYKEWAGLYQEGQQFLYVNRGFGFLGYPGRVGILPEITRIEFVKSKK